MELRRAELKANYELKLNWIIVETKTWNTFFTESDSDSEFESELTHLPFSSSPTPQSLFFLLPNKSTQILVDFFTFFCIRGCKLFLVHPPAPISNLVDLVLSNWLWITNPTTVVVSSASFLFYFVISPFF